MKKIVLLSLSLILLCSVSAIGASGTTNENSKVSDEISILGIDYEYLQDMKETKANLINVHDNKSIVSVDISTSKEQTFFVCVVGLDNGEHILINDYFRVVLTGNLSDRNQKISDMLKSIEKEHGVKPIISSDSHQFATLGGRSHGKNRFISFHKHVHGYEFNKDPNKFLM